LVLALAGAALAALPSQFILVQTYTGSGAGTCSIFNGGSDSSEYVAPGVCIAGYNSLAASMFAISGNSILQSDYITPGCTGTAAVSYNYSLSTSCNPTSSGGVNYQLYNAGSGRVNDFFQFTLYSDADCSTLHSGPEWDMLGICSQFGPAGALVNLTVVGENSNLQVCQYNNAKTPGCGTQSNPTSCSTVGQNTCLMSPTGSGYIMYVFNAASSSTPAVALTAVLMAVVAFATKF